MRARVQVSYVARRLQARLSMARRAVPRSAKVARNPNISDIVIIHPPSHERARRGVSRGGWSA